MLGYTNLDSTKGFLFFQKFMEQNGIIKELKKLGLSEGDTVRVRDYLDFEYYEGDGEERCVQETDIAQVTSGGVNLSEINPETCESKIVKNLYFAGEIMDVDGPCGGYNVHFAWSSGIAAGKSVH